MGIRFDPEFSLRLASGAFLRPLPRLRDVCGARAFGMRIVCGIKFCAVGVCLECVLVYLFVVSGVGCWHEDLFWSNGDSVLF
jgi:hypothetical protein